MKLKNLENIILSFENWSQPWTFKETISKDPELSVDEAKIFDEIWTKTSSTEFWKDLDLVLSCKATQSFIRNNYNLSDDAIAKIVRALSFNYR